MTDEAVDVRAVSNESRRRLLAAGVLVLLGGCGFHLRGDATYPFTSLYVNASAVDPFTVELKRAIEGAAGTRLTDDAATAQVILDVTGPVDDKQVLSLSGGGRVREFLLIKRVTVGLRDLQGHEWLAPAEVQVRRSYTFNETQVLAREAQEIRLLKEMQTDIVQQIVRRLQAARPAA